MDWPVKAFKALAYAIEGYPESARMTLRAMTRNDLDQLSDALDKLAALVDEVTIEDRTKARP